MAVQGPVRPHQAGSCSIREGRKSPGETNVTCGPLLAAVDGSSVAPTRREASRGIRRCGFARRSHHVLTRRRRPRSSHASQVCWFFLRRTPA
jgi:hypothetical protein